MARPRHRPGRHHLPLPRCRPLHRRRRDAQSCPPRRCAGRRPDCRSDGTDDARAADAAQGRLRQATSHLELALALCREDGDRIGEARALGNLGMADYCQGRYQQSAGCHQRALAIYRDVGDHAGEARERQHLGIVDLRQGRYEQAAGHLRRSLALFRDAGFRSGEAHVLGNLGELELRQGRTRRPPAHSGDPWGWAARSAAGCAKPGPWLAWACPSCGRAAASRPSGISGSRWLCIARPAIALVRPRR